MGLYGQWKGMFEQERSGREYEAFWDDYLKRETKIYEYILENHESIVEGTLEELALKFDTDPVIFTGFLDGINSSLITGLKLDDLDMASSIRLEIDYGLLYRNMMEAKASWLYNLPQWEGILTPERRNEIKLAYRKSKMAVSTKVGRNDPCPCGSGKKYKKCCGKEI